MSTHETDTNRGRSRGASAAAGWAPMPTKGRLRAQPPVRFEATFTEPDGEGKFRGTILDDHELGEANVAGGQSGRGVRFSKRYRRRGAGVRLL